MAQLATLLLVLTTAVGVLLWKSEAAPENGDPPSGIAVLPFESLSSDNANPFFAGGIYDGVSTKLAKVANLKVISHNSVAKYRGVRNAQEIGRALHVAYVLKGSVRRSAGMIHVDIQLVDARNNSQIWAEEYNRNLTGVFDLQSQIAQKVADRLGVDVSSTEKAAIQEPPTTDLIAYDAYLRAKDLINEIVFSTRQKEDLFQAVKLLERAVARDPYFLDAYGLLVGAHDRIYFGGFDHSDARLKLSETIIQSLQQLRPESGEAHLAAAQHSYWAYADYERAKQELALAEQTLPNESRIPLLAAYIARREGRWEEALEEMKQALELNPRDFSVLQQIALTYEALRQYKEMAATLDQVLAMAPKDIPSRVRRALADVEERADPGLLRMVIDTILADDANAAPMLTLVNPWLFLAVRDRDPIATRSVLSRMSGGGCYDESIPFPNGWCEGFVAWSRGDKVAALAAFAGAREELNQKVQSQPDYAAALCALGAVNAVLGNKEEAIRQGERAVELIPVSKNAIDGATLVRYLAAIYAWTGEKDRAIERLAELIKLPGGHISYGYLRLHPLWDPLRGDPRFEAMVNSLAPK